MFTENPLPPGLPIIYSVVLASSVGSTRWPPELQALPLKQQNSSHCSRLCLLIHQHPGQEKSFIQQVLTMFQDSLSLIGLILRHMTILEPITIAREWESLNKITSQGPPLSQVWQSISGLRVEEQEKSPKENQDIFSRRAQWKQEDSLVLLVTQTLALALSSHFISSLCSA